MQVGVIILFVYQEKIDGYVCVVVVVGVKVQFGGVMLLIVELLGCFYQLIVVIGVMVDMLIVCEEVFGLVFLVLIFCMFDEVIDFVNDVFYGFLVGVWSENVYICFEFFCCVQVGIVWINIWMDGFFEFIFGGFK